MVEHTNELIDWGIQNYGAEFATRLQQETGMKKTKVLHLRPSVSLGSLAYEVFVASEIKTTKTLQWMFAKIHDQSASEKSSFLLSFLLFDALYTRAAEDLGYRDCVEQEEELLAFFA